MKYVESFCCFSAFNMARLGQWKCDPCCTSSQYPHVLHRAALSVKKQDANYLKKHYTPVLKGSITGNVQDEKDN